ncbi:SDR family oxidoreductase [Clostridium sp. 19966]|uniref:SDR family oxidoreductase n=1 Tax=Clostridium sp. 19966 TaxID=2768166 RepID=UPI0028DF03B1|nr:SDR family oxidoreductase [Clostridium sp. 19966]MDT8718709.1 SDR family oxidoreductase [Clostridium sp. 19966]
MYEKKVVLITGASSGIGRATALYLADKGIKVYGTSRSGRGDDELKSKDISMVAMDVTDDNSVKKAVREISEKAGTIDVLINNAGSGISGPLEETSMDEFKNLFEINFFGTVRVIDNILPIMRERRSGIIINTSSIGGIIGLPYQGVYSSTKFAIEGYTEALSKELNEFGIKVCMIQPGDFCTGFTKNRIFTKATDKNSPYYKSFAKTLVTFEHDENNGCNPEKIGKLIFNIIKSKHIKERYIVGYFFQKLSVMLKRILPGRIFEKIIISYYIKKGDLSEAESKDIENRINKIY